jgi:hypothetical protein
MNRHLLTALALPLVLFELTAMLCALPSQAGYPVYPPTASQRYIVFEDSDNEAQVARGCQADRVCVMGYYLPRGFTLAKTQAGVPMLTQGLFFSPDSIWKHRVVYNVTLEADLEGVDQALSEAQQKIAQKYALAPNQVRLSPLYIGDLQVLARNAYGSNEATETADPKKLARVGFTQFIAPDWKGDFHNLSSRFSLSIRGPMWDLEPTLQNMFLNEGGNAAVGSLSFKIRVLAKPVKAKFECELAQFQKVVRETTKYMHSYRYSSASHSESYFTNDEWNAIRKSLDIQSFCKISEFTDTTIPNSAEVLADRGEQLKKMLFEQAFQVVTAQGIEKPIDPSDPLYTRFESSSQAEGKIKTTIDLEESRVFFLSSDLDFYAGGVTTKNLDPAHKYLCLKWERFDLSLPNGGACRAVCQPAEQTYMKHHPKADSNGCVNIDDAEVPRS